MSENTESESALEESSKRDLVFGVKFIEDLTFWAETNRKTALRLLSLIQEIRRDPFEGTRKPERLKYQDGNVSPSRFEK